MRLKIWKFRLKKLTMGYQIAPGLQSQKDFSECHECDAKKQIDDNCGKK